MKQRDKNRHSFILTLSFASSFSDIFSHCFKTVLIVCILHVENTLQYLTYNYVVSWLIRYTIFMGNTVKYIIIPEYIACPCFYITILWNSFVEFIVPV